MLKNQDATALFGDPTPGGTATSDDGGLDMPPVLVYDSTTMTLTE